MAGGKGERLRPLTEKTPKPLLPVGSKAIIDHNVDKLINYGIQHISVTVNYLKEQIEEHQRKISSSSIDELGAMLIEKGGNNVKWARIELKARYKKATHAEQMEIISYFKRGTTKQDVKWGEVRAQWQQRGYAEPPRFF